MKSAEEVMEILEAYNLTKSLRAAAALAGCSHHTVARVVAERDAGDVAAPPRELRPMLIDPFLPKLEEWVENSRGRIRADVAQRSWRRSGSPGPNAPRAARSRRSKRAVPARAHPGASAVGHRAGAVVAVRLRRGPARGRGARRCCCVRGWRGRGIGW